MNDTSPVRRSQARSRTWQLLSMAFSHPLPELHAQMADGRFQAALGDALTVVTGTDTFAPLTAVACEFSAFEAQYIALFESGQKGRPMVPLCAGEYVDLLDGQPRPALMLKYAQFYKHFGLKARDQGEDNELPDHLTCQLECLAWLAYLETHALKQDRPAADYRRAQRDFIAKLLLPFATGVDARLTGECAKHGFDPLFPALSQITVNVQQRTLIEFESLYGSASAVAPPSSTDTKAGAATAGQDLWG